jgi:hypothetical protein
MKRPERKFMAVMRSHAVSLNRKVLQHCEMVAAMMQGVKKYFDKECQSFIQAFKHWISFDLN